MIQATEVDDFVVDNLDHVERLAGCDRVHEHKAVNSDGMLGVEDGVLILAGGGGLECGSGAEDREEDAPDQRCR